MKTYTELIDLFTNLSNNTSPSNQSLGGQLISDQHRYLLQKYFDNERTYSTTTRGAETLTVTAPLNVGDVKATLTTPWDGPSTQQLIVFNAGGQRNVVFTQNSADIFWQNGLTASASTTITTIGVQAYPIPPNVSKIKNDTITVGQLVYTPSPVQSIQEWTMLNALPYTSDIPNNFFIYQNQVMFWPIPSTSGNIITFNYKARVSDLSFSNYSDGTLTNITLGSNLVTGVATNWNTTGNFPLNVDLSYFNLYLKIDPPSGEGIWYPIQKFTTDSNVTLSMPIQNVPSATAAKYSIGQLPLLQEDFHDMLVYGALTTYYASIVDNDKSYAKYKGMYDERLNLLEAYAGTKSVNVDLGGQPTLNNPNLFYFASN